MLLFCHTHRRWVIVAAIAIAVGLLAKVKRGSRLVWFIGATAAAVLKLPLNLDTRQP